MKVYHDISSRIMEFGSSRFYEHVREHIAIILTDSGLEITDDLSSNMYHLYNRYAAAYIIGSTSWSAEMFLEYLIEEYDEADESSTVIATDDSAQRLRLSGYEVANRFKDLETDVMYNFSITHRVLPGCTGSEAQHQRAFEIAERLFRTEHETIGLDGLHASRTGLASVVASIAPGVYMEHYGDDYQTLVVICEHESLF